MQKRHVKAIMIAATVLSVLLALAAIPLFISSRTTHASNASSSATPTSTIQQTQNTGFMTTINGLIHSSVLGSTQFIVDKAGHTISVDANPYDGQIVPSTPATSANATNGS